MARLQIHLESSALRFTAQVDVAVPQFGAPRAAQGLSEDKFYSPDNKLPVMFLYHGGSGDRSDWFRFTRVEELSEKYGFIVVCPSAQNSCYMNMAYGPRWSDFINIELYDWVHAMFPASTDREKNFAVGLSMGGYGAFRSALLYPERFGYAAALSSGVEIPQEIANGTVPFGDKGLSLTGGAEGVLGSVDDMFAQAEKLAASGRELPKLFAACGTEDFTFPANVRFRDHLLKLGYDLTWLQDRGTHNWDYWDKHIRTVCGWLPLE